ADVDVEAQVGERGRDHLGPAVMAVLPDLGHQQAGAPALIVDEAVDLLAHRLPVGVVREVASVDAGDGPDLRLVAAPDALQGVRDLADRGSRPRRLHREPEEVALPRLRTALQRGQRLTDLAPVTRGADALQPADLRLAHRRVVDLARVDLGLLGQRELVHADDHVLAPIDTGLAARA